MKPNDFHLNTDFASVKNDSGTELTLDLPVNGVVIPAGGNFVYSTNVDVGTRNSGLRVQMSSSLDPPRRVGWQRAFTLNVTTAGTSYDDYFVANLVRISPTTLRLYVIIVNFNGGGTLTINSPNQSITAYIKTFLSPFN